MTDDQSRIADRDVTHRQPMMIRTWAAWLLLGTAAVQAVTQALALAQSGVLEVTAGGTLAQPLFSLSGLVVIGAPLLAVLLTVTGGEPLRSARGVTVVATGCYVVALLMYAVFVAFLVTGGFRMVAPDGLTVAMVPFVVMEALLLGLLVLAASYVDNLRRALRPTVEGPATASDVR